MIRTVAGLILISVGCISPVIASDRTLSVIEVFILGEQLPELQGLDTASLDGVNLYVHQIDAVHQWERQRSHALQAAQREALAAAGQESFTHEQATAGAGQLVGTFTDDERQLLVEGWQTLRRASALGIDRSPAIVFNQQTVIYGVTQLDVAIRLWQERFE